MISSVSGSALVIAGQEKHPAKPLMSLTPRTLIELQAGASVTLVFFSRGSQERFTGPVLIGVGKHRAQVMQGDASARQEVATGSAMIQAIDPHALKEPPLPGGVTVVTEAGRTAISWSASTPGPYLVTVYQLARQGQERVGVWAESLAGTKVMYTGPTLDLRQTYAVEVKAGEQRIAGSFFRLSHGQAEMLTAAAVEAEQMRAATPSDTTPHVVMHTLYQQTGQHAQAVSALYPAAKGQPEEDAFLQRLNAMGHQINRQADQNTAEIQGIYAAEENWTFAPYWDPERWAWDGWDDL